VPFHLTIPEPVERTLALAPEAVRETLLDGLFRSLRRLDASGGQEALGERVEDLKSPMFILRAETHWLLYEVDPSARRLLVHSLARMPEAGPAGGGEVQGG
jgi:hypothetical protein